MNMKYKYEICIWFQVKAIADKSKKKYLGIPKDKFGIVVNWDMEGMMRSEIFNAMGAIFFLNVWGTYVFLECRQPAPVAPLPTSPSLLSITC